MGAVFVVLILLALSIKAITLLDRENVALVESHAVSDSGDLDPDSGNSDSITGQQVAAMAVAIALADSGSVPTQALTPVRRTLSPDAWLQSGRTRAMSSSGSLVRDRRI
jgi:Na+-transporting methylmalonyl-CoA/oxaloacetate decarboxylase gamma subunit